MPRTAVQSRRSRTSCSILALATVMAVGATPAAAQSFLGSGTYTTNPNATGITTGVNTTTINLNGGQTIIDWVPTDNAVGGGSIAFQNSGTTALFTGATNFAVLNRINQTDTSRAIFMNGTVNSRVNGSQGGSVYFYSPGGFIFGGSSSFSVGSLVVTALPIVVSGGSFIANFGTDNTVQFGQAPNPNAAISNSGTINANIPAFGVGGAAGDSYVAMVAPRVNHSGAISVNGSAALVAAEAATISFSTDGLFDIQVTTGTTSSSGINVNGDIGGPTPEGSTDKQGIYLVAVPKNDALTMVIGSGSDLGFTLANNAAIDDNGAVVLSAGHDITNGAIGAKSAGHGANATANFWFTGAHATNNLFGEATGTADLYSVLGGQATTVFDNDVTVHAGQSVRMGVSGAGTSLSVAGNVNLSADRSGADGQPVTAGFAEIYAYSSGLVSIAGSTILTADGFGGDSGDSIAAASGTGGSVNLTATGGGGITFGNAQSGGDVFLSASGNGGTGFDGGSGNGTGGTLSIQASTGGDITIFGDTDAFAEGRGGTNWDSLANGGVGQGGNIFVGVSGTGSTLSLTGALMSANGIGGGAGEGTCCAAVGGSGIGGLFSLVGSNGALIQSNGTLEFSAAGEGGFASGIGGSGTGGRNGKGVLIDAQAGLTFNATNLWLDASGSGGDGDAGGGSGTGGHASLNVSGGTVNVSNQLNVDADGFGGDSYDGGNGGSATGGLAEMATNGATAQLNVLHALIEADATGGDSLNFSEGPLGEGGDALGGRTRAVANDGVIHITGNLDMDATATGGSGVNGGDAAGIVTPSDNEGLQPAAFVWAGAATAELRVDGLTEIDVSATGGDGVGGNGGQASAGEIDIVSRHGDVLLGDVIGIADAFGGAGGFGGGAGGNAFGGAIDVSWSIDQTTGLSGFISIDTAALSANATGGTGGEGMFVQGGTGGTGGAGGNGTGGGISYTGSAGGGTLDVGSTTLQANGIGGDGGDGGSGDTGGTGGAGGNGTGGFIQTGTISNDLSTTSGGTATFTFLSASANASGGTGGDGGEGVNATGLGGDGGDAIGGQANFLVRGIAVTADSVNLFANATGGNGGFGSASGNGGDASSGFVSFESKDRFGHPTQRGTLTADAITGTAIATGGTGATNGTSTVRGGSFFRVLNGDANIGTVNFTFAGDLYSGAGGPNFILAQDGAAVVGDFSYSTTGDLAIYTTSTGSITATNMNLEAGNFVDYPAAPEPANPGTIFATNLTVTSGGDFIADANLNVINGIDITVPGSIRFDNATTVSFVDLDAQGGSIDLDNLTADGDIFLNANGLIDIGTVQAGFFRGDAGTTFTSNNITSDSDIRIGAGGNVTLGDLSAGLPAGESSKAIRIDTDGSVLVGGMVALGGIDVTAQGSVTGGEVTTGDVLITEADGAISYGNISAGLVNPQPASEPASVVLDSATAISVGNIDAAGTIGLITTGALAAGNLDSGADILALVHGSIAIDDINADGRVLLADSSMFTNAGGVVGDAGDDNIDIEDIFAAAPVATGGAIAIGDVLAGSFTAAAGTSLTTGLIDTDSAITLGANGAITTGNLVAGDFVLGNGGSITTGTIDASSVAMTSESGNIATGDIFAFGAVELDAFGDIATGDIVAGSIDLLAGDDIATGNLTTQQLALLGLGDGGITALLFPGASITLEAGGDIATGNIFSIDGVYADAGGDIATGWIFANDFVELYAGDDISTGYIDAGQYIYADSIGDQSLGNLTAGWDIDLTADGNIAFASGNAGVLFEFEADGSVTGGNVVAGLTIEGEAGGSVSLGNLTAGLNPGEATDDDSFSVGIQAAGPISVGNVQGADRVGFATLGSLATGSIQSGWDFFAIADGNITTGAITTGAGDQVFMSGTDVFFDNGGGEDSDFDPDGALAAGPTLTGGSITINGAVNTGTLQAAAGTSLSTQAVNAEDVRAFAGGLAAINGAWTVGDAIVISNDIEISAGGSITASGDIALVSKNATRTVVGDGVALTGYNLSNAEFGKLSANDITILADTAEGAAASMLIGTLNVNAAGLPGGVDYSFLTGNSDTEVASGSIRVVGNAVFNGMTTTDHSVNFGTARFELDTTTGSISLFSTGSTLGGELGLYADRIHVAQGTILTQLAANPTYTGYQEDLNEEPDVLRPEGVLRADTLWIESDNLQSILIQNTGTFQTRAGFLVRQAFVNDDELVAGPPGSINLVVNGQVVTDGGTLTGVEARDALIGEGTDITPFTSNSTINGCPLTGACIIAPPPPPPTADVVDNQIDLITGGGLGDGEFGNEDDIDDNEEGDEAANNPISPPQPLFDTRPLIPSSDVNDPVSGTGNPALLGTSECVDDEDTQCGTEKETGQ